MNKLNKLRKDAAETDHKQAVHFFLLTFVLLFCPMEMVLGDRTALFAYFGGFWIDPSLYSHSTNTLVDCLRCEDWVASCLGSLIKIQLSFWFLKENGGTLGKKRMLHFSSQLPYLLKCRNSLCQFTHTHTLQNPGGTICTGQTFSKALKRLWILNVMVFLLWRPPCPGSDNNSDLWGPLSTVIRSVNKIS